MNIGEQIENYIASLPEKKRNDILVLHRLATEIDPGNKLWFLDGKNSEGKIVSNPSIGYGSCQMKYADGTSREFYRIGLSANTSGISVYVMGLDDKTYLARTYGETIGKANVTGYCIKFKSLGDVKLQVLETIIRNSLASAKP